MTTAEDCDRACSEGHTYEPGCGLHVPDDAPGGGGIDRLVADAGIHAPLGPQYDPAAAGRALLGDDYDVDAEDPPGMLLVRNADGTVAAILDDDHDPFAVSVAATEAAIRLLEHQIGEWVLARSAGNARVVRQRAELARLQSALRTMHKVAGDVDAEADDG